MEISFVVPAYNEERLIAECLRSILREIEASGCDAEVIVVDNASTDGTARVASGFRGVRVVVEPRRGVMLARQRGFRESRGDIVACIDADSRLTRGWIDTVRREFAASRRLVCLTGPCVSRDISAVTRIGALGWYIVASVLYGLVLQRLFRTAALLQACNHAVRRTALVRIGGYNTAIDFHGDEADMSRRLVRVGRVKFSFRLPIYTSGRRLRQEGALRTAWGYALDSLFMILYGRCLSRPYTAVRE